MPALSKKRIAGKLGYAAATSAKNVQHLGLLTKASQFKRVRLAAAEAVAKKAAKIGRALIKCEVSVLQSVKLQGSSRSRFLWCTVCVVKSNG